MGTELGPGRLFHDAVRISSSAPTARTFGPSDRSAEKTAGGGLEVSGVREPLSKPAIGDGGPSAEAGTSIDDTREPRLAFRKRSDDSAPARSRRAGGDPSVCMLASVSSATETMMASALTSADNGKTINLRVGAAAEPCTCPKIRRQDIAGPLMLPMRTSPRSRRRPTIPRPRL